MTTTMTVIGTHFFRRGDSVFVGDVEMKVVCADTCTLTVRRFRWYERVWRAIVRAYRRLRTSHSPQPTEGQ